MDGPFSIAMFDDPAPSIDYQELIFSKQHIISMFWWYQHLSSTRTIDYPVVMREQAMERRKGIHIP